MTIPYRSAFSLTAAALSTSFLVAVSAHGEPAIQNIQGSLSAGSTLVVQGRQFGATGPHVALIDDFERGSAGEPIDAAAVVGTWSATDSAPLIDSAAHSGTRAILAYDAAAGKMRQLSLALDAPTSEIFISYWVRLGPASPFPGAVPGLGSFSTDSSWKFAWIMDGAEGFSADGKFDMALPSHTGKGAFALVGNDADAVWLGNDWWSWNGWMRLSTWIRSRDGLTATASSGTFQALSSQKGLSQKDLGSRDVFARAADRRFDRLTIPGWIRTGSDSALRPLYDDVYVAVGPGAPARVELGDAPTYSASHSLTILPSVTWTDTRVDVRVPDTLPALASEKLYLYVTDAHGVVSARGFPIQCSSCPRAPTGVMVK
jgi:hypothetical protein